MNERLLVMRHGPAEALAAHHAGDAERRLTGEGRERTARACEALARFLHPPDRIYSSPYQRACETAELLAEAFETPELAVTPLLKPGFDHEQLARMIAEPGGTAAIVAHEPDLSEFLGWLSGARVAMDKGTVCVTELAAPGTAQLFAIYSLDALNVLGEA